MRLSGILLLVAASTAFSQENSYRFGIDQDRLHGVADFGFLNHPLTAADRVFAGGAQFLTVGPDGRANTSDDSRIRFFGVNMAFGANFPAPEEAPRIARRLRRLGVNLVRLHHMDSSPDAVPARARSILTTGPYPSLNSVSLQRLRAFLDALKAEGIYVNLNLHVGYQFRPEVDQVPALPPEIGFPQQSKPLHIFYPRMVDLQVEFTRRLIAALNLRDDPVLAMVELDNETSLVDAWQNGSLERYARGEYGVELERRHSAFLKARNLPADEKSYLLFLAETDRAYLARMLAAVRETAGPLVPVAGTQIEFGGLLNLDSHRDLSYQDNHFYIDHYNFPHHSWDARDWRIRDSSAVGGGLAAFLNMAASREAGRPYTVSEFNQAWPNRQAAEIDPLLAAFAAFQDWDGVMHFAYEHDRTWFKETPGGFDLNGDVGKLAGFGQAAWLFRSGAIAPARDVVTIPVSLETRLRAAREKRNANVAAALTAAGGYDPAIALVHRVALAREEEHPLPAGVKAPLASPYTADTGQLTFDRDRRLYLIHAPAAAGIFGFMGAGGRASSGPLEVELDRTARGFVSLLLTALDGKLIPKSHRLLLTLPGYAMATQPGTEPARPQQLIHYPETTDWWTVEPDPQTPDKPSGDRDGAAPPVWMERIACVLRLQTSVRHLRVFPLDSTGARLPQVPTQRVSKGLRIPLHADSPWYELADR